MEHTLLNTIKLAKMLRSMKPGEIDTLLKKYGINKRYSSLNQEGGLAVEMELQRLMDESELTVELTANELSKASQVPKKL